MFVLVCYDISDDRRRVRVGSELENFGCRVQYSVFECHLQEPQLRELHDRLLTLIDEQEDHLRYYALCPKDERAVLVDGLGHKTQDWDYHVV
ncbi:MAG: CRISPR-associated endonuclease Cas2 [Gammaproteobacteria bacterium]